MFKALGISKKGKPANDVQISKHREQQQMRDQWREDAQAILGILSKLGQAYGAHKGDFALGRYEGLKNMIKEAISEYNVLIAHSKARNSGKYSEVAKQYGGKNASGGKSSSVADGQKKHALSSLKENAQAMALHQDTQRTAADLSAKEIEEDLTKFRREILQYKQDFKDGKDRLEKISTEYEASKQFSPPQRYNELKNMIKIATRPSGQSSVPATAKAGVK